MAATAEQIDTVRRKTGVSIADYSDKLIAEYIETYPLVDARGENPTIESETDAGTLDENPDWISTSYDLNAAAADVWAEKAASLAANFDFSADGGNYSRSQAYEQAMKQSRYYRARRSMATITQRPEPLMQGTEEIDDDD